MTIWQRFCDYLMKEYSPHDLSSIDFVIKPKDVRLFVKLEQLNEREQIELNKLYKEYLYENRLEQIAKDFDTDI